MIGHGSHTAQFEPMAQPDMTKARKKLAKYTEVASEKAGFIAISVTDRDRIDAAQC
jgi:hypothetical protein